MAVTVVMAALRMAAARRRILLDKLVSVTVFCNCPLLLSDNMNRNQVKAERRCGKWQKKNLWSKILKALIAAATAVLGVLGGTNVLK